MDLPEDWFEKRRAAYHAHLEDSVTHVSPLLLDAATAGEIANALSTMGPPYAFPTRAWTESGWIMLWRQPHHILEAKAGSWNYRPGCKAGRDAVFARRFRSEGEVVRLPGHPLGGLGIRVMGDSLEMALLLRGSLVVTLRGLVRVTMPTVLPETVATAARGRSLCELVDSPLFKDRDYRIRKAVVRDGTSTITATAPNVPYVVRIPRKRGTGTGKRQVEL